MKKETHVRRMLAKKQFSLDEIQKSLKTKFGQGMGRSILIKLRRDILAEPKSALLKGIKETPDRFFARSPLPKKSKEFMLEKPNEMTNLKRAMKKYRRAKKKLHDMETQEAQPSIVLPNTPFPPTTPEKGFVDPRFAQKNVDLTKWIEPSASLIDALISAQVPFVFNGKCIALEVRHGAYDIEVQQVYSVVK